jgi:hypothetical protein
MQGSPELAQAEKFVVFLAYLLPQLRRMFGQPPIDGREMLGQGKGGGFVTLLQRLNRGRRFGPSGVSPRVLLLLEQDIGSHIFILCNEFSAETREEAKKKRKILP